MSAGTDSSEKGKVRWARVKGAVENALLALPLNAYTFRPGAIVPMHGVQSKTPLYRALYAGLGPPLRLLRLLLPNYILTTEQIGLAMIKVARRARAEKHPRTARYRRSLNATSLESYCFSANTYIDVPALIATYCLPFTE